MKRILIFTVLMSMTLISCNKGVNTPKPTIFPTSEAAYDNQIELYAEFPLSESDIVFVGSNFMANGNWAELFSTQSIKNRSIVGECVDGLVYRAASIASGKPHKIFIQTGFNDIVNGAEPKDVYKGLVKACHIIKDISPNTEIYVLNLYNSKNVMDANKVNDYNALLAKDSKMYTFIDIASALSNEDGSFNESFADKDRTLTQLGYATVAAVLAPEIDLTPNPVSAAQSILIMGGDEMAQVDWTEVIPIQGIIDRTCVGANLLTMGTDMTEFVLDAPGKIFITISRSDVSLHDNVNLWDTYKNFIENFKVSFPNTQLYILAALPYGTASLNYGDGVFNEKSAEFNKLVSAAQSKYDFLFLDPSTVLADESGALKDEFTYDGENLNVDGIFTLAAMLIEGPRMLVLTPDALLN